MSRRLRLHTLALALAFAMAGRVAAADPTPADAARASALFTEGRKLLDASSLDAACDKFSASLALDPQIGTRLNLADCRERQGRLVEAYTLFDQAADEATRTNKTGRATFAKEHVASLARKLVRVVLHVVDQPGLAVTLAGTAVPRAGWTTAHVLPAGPIVVDASAPGKKPLHVERRAVAGADVTIDVPALPSETATSVTNPTALPTTTPQSSVIVGVTRTAVPSRRARVPVYAATAGGVLFATSIALAFHARSRWETADDAGDGPGVTSAQHEADVATAVGVIGLAGAATGLVLYLRRPHGHVVLTPTTDGTITSMLLSGSF